MRIILDNILRWVLLSLMAIMTLDVLWGVFTRYVMGAQASWSEELARFLLIWIGILGAAYASGKDLHLSIDLFPNSLSPAKRRTLMVVIHLLVIFFVLVAMVIGGGRLVYVTSILGQESAALEWPLAAIYTVMPLSGLIIIYYKITEIITELNSTPTGEQI